ncbi:LysR family transcriptional regulator [Pseudovibrio sp. SCP19]|uniref:LysR family transcriptional regulator n=1 Tax=Pseudovibrio sp. SCP19 TaxID=3141374 RepID=UPI00333AF638
MHSITLLRLEIFRSVYESASITEAANRLGVSQPTVSRQLKDFEAASGCKFFQYIGGRMQPTMAGRKLYEESRQVQEGISRVQVLLDSIKSGTSQPIGIRSVSTLCEYILPSVVEKRLRRDPQERFDIGVAGVAEQIKSLRTFLIQVGFFFGDVICDDLERTLIGHGYYALKARKDHPLASFKRVCWEDVVSLGDNTLALPSNGPVCQPLFDAEPRLKSIGEKRLLLRNVNLAEPFASKMGVARLIDSFSAGSETSNDHTVLPVYPIVKFPVWAIFDPRERGNQQIQSFIEEVRLAVMHETNQFECQYL